MSEMEHIKGRLIPVFESLPVEEACRAVLTLQDQPEDDSYSSAVEHLQEYGCRRFYIGPDAVYAMESKGLCLDDDICTAEQKSNGQVVFELRYYNGGASFDEMLDCAMKEISNEQK